MIYIILIALFFSSFCIAETTSNKEDKRSLQSSETLQKSEIPTLDMEDFFAENQQRQTAFMNNLGDALTEYGFVLIKNHGISQETIESAYSSAKEFFELPMETKRQYQSLQLNRGFRGYDPDRKDKKSDLQEYWHVGPESQMASYVQNIPAISENVWPKEIPQFQHHLQKLYQEIYEKSQALLQACSLYMGKERNFLTAYTQYGDSVMRVIHYLPNEAKKQDWKAPHQDPNLLTVIAGVSMKGLEVQLKDGTWVEVPYKPEALIVSASNMLSSLSNGLIRSAPHRVVIKKANASRYSIPFFFHMQRNLSIAPLAECIEKTGGKPLYPTQTAKESLTSHRWFQSK